MAVWIHKLSAAGELTVPISDPVAVVERIGSMDGMSAEGCQVFASKYAHFCVDRKSFPVFDKYAARALLRHWGRDESLLEGRWRYRKFEYVMRRVLAESTAGVRSYGDLDAYLWLAGVYREWVRAAKENRIPAIATECRLLFEFHAGQPDRIGELLQQMVPVSSFFNTVTSDGPPS